MQTYYLISSNKYLAKTEVLHNCFILTTQPEERPTLWTGQYWDENFTLPLSSIFTVGLDDFRRLFQTKWFYDFLKRAK